MRMTIYVANSIVRTSALSLHGNTLISVQIHFLFSSFRSCVLKIAFFICSLQNTTKITPLSWDCGEMCSAQSAKRLFHHCASQISVVCLRLADSQMHPCIHYLASNLCFKPVTVQNILTKSKELKGNYFGFRDSNTTAVLNPKCSKLC